MQSYRDLLKAVSSVAFVMSRAGAVRRERGVSHAEKLQLEPQRASLEMSRLFLAHVD